MATPRTTDLASFLGFSPPLCLYVFLLWRTLFVRESLRTKRQFYYPRRFPPPERFLRGRSIATSRRTDKNSVLRTILARESILGKLRSYKYSVLCFTKYFVGIHLATKAHELFNRRHSLPSSRRWKPEIVEDFPRKPRLLAPISISVIHPFVLSLSLFFSLLERWQMLFLGGRVLF